MSITPESADPARTQPRCVSTLARLGGLILSMLMTALAAHALLVAGASAEAPAGCQVCEQGHIYGTTGFAGSYAVPTANGPIANTYCITQGLNYPNSVHEGSDDVDYADEVVWAALFDIAGPTDTDKAAVSMRVHRDIEGSPIEWNAFGDLRARSDQLWLQAAALAGPFSTALEWRQRPDAANGGKGLVAVSIRSAAGTPVPDATATLSWANMNGPDSASTGPTGVVDLAVNVVSPGPWSIQAAGAGLPATTVVRYAGGSGEQTVIGSGPRSASSPASDSGTWDVPTR